MTREWCVVPTRNLFPRDPYIRCESTKTPADVSYGAIRRALHVRFAQLRSSLPHIMHRQSLRHVKKRNAKKNSREICNETRAAITSK